MNNQFANHPIDFIREIIDDLGNGIYFELSRYTYSPQTIADQRKIFRIGAGELTHGFLASLIGELDAGEEVALNSRVYLPDGTHQHIPMIDFQSEVVRSDLGILGEALGFEFTRNLHLYASGRAYHGYSLPLITQEDWPAFMGTLLLTNLPGGKPLVDTRWVGHRLRAGFSALRWSFHTSAYLAYPTRVSI